MYLSCSENATWPAIKLKRTIKIAAIVIVASIALLLIGKREAFLEMHYDTLDQRIVERTSLLGITINETISFRRGGYGEQYHSIYGADPPDDRWHSVSMRPIRKNSLFTEYYLSAMTPPAVLSRNMIAEEIFKRYEHNQSASLGKEAFSDLEAVLPSTVKLEEIDRANLSKALDRMKKIKTLQDLPIRYY